MWLPFRHQGINTFTITQCFNIAAKYVAAAHWSNTTQEQHYGPELILGF